MMSICPLSLTLRAGTSRTALRSFTNHRASSCVRLLSTKPNKNIKAIATTEDTSDSDDMLSEYHAALRRLKPKECRLPSDFSERYPDFLPERVFSRRNPIRELLERRDMLRRRMHIDLPVFYVGSIIAVTLSDPYAAGRSNRFLGLCIRKDKTGLRHNVTLRNSYDDMGVEVMYDLYNPLIQKVEVIKLEKHVDDDLRYLKDAEPQYSYFPQDMEPVPHPPDAPVPINDTKVKLKEGTPWSMRYELKAFKGVDEHFWALLSPWYKYKFISKTPMEAFKVHDIVDVYRDDIALEDQEQIYDSMLSFERHHEPQLRAKKRNRMFRFSGRPDTLRS